MRIQDTTRLLAPKYQKAFLFLFVLSLIVYYVTGSQPIDDQFTQNCFAGFFIGLIAGFFLSAITDNHEVGGGPNTLLGIVGAFSGVMIAIAISNLS